MTLADQLRKQKENAKRSLRTHIQANAGKRSWTTQALRSMLELAGYMPSIGPLGNRWAGLIYASQGEDSRAASLFQNALERGLRGHPSLHYDLGMSLLRIGKPAEAELQFRQAIRIAPNAAWTYTGLTQSLIDQGKHLCVIPELLVASRNISPAEICQLPFPSYLCEKVAKEESVYTELRDLVTKHPQAFHATVLLARAESIRSNPQTAVALLRAAAAIHFEGREVPNAPFAKPRFLIIGQPKAGTTALFHYLIQHPFMVAPIVKEPHYWSQFHHLGNEWYQSFFPRLPPQSELFTGEGSVLYLTHPEAPARIARELPEAKLIVILRNPVSRAYSEHAMFLRLGMESRSFDEVVQEEISRFPTCPLEDTPLALGESPDGYLTRSAVLPSLKRWLRYFPPEQLLILRNEQLANELPAVLDRVCQFLGITNDIPADQKRHNEGRYPPMSPVLKQTLTHWFQDHQQALGDFLDQLPGTCLLRP